MTDKQILAEAIKKNGWIKKGEFILSSGKTSDFYIDLRPLILSSRYIHLALVPLVQLLTPTLRTDIILCGVTTRCLSLVGSLIHRLSSVSVEVSSCVARTNEMDHGTKRMVEGDVHPGQEVIVMDDVATSGTSLMNTIRVLRNHGLVVRKSITILDREEGARELLNLKNVELESVLTLKDIR